MSTVRKLKETLKIRLSESPMQMLHQTSWLLHWVIVYSFTAEGSNGLLATLLSEKTSDPYHNVIQLRSPHLMRYMVASFLLARSSQQTVTAAHKLAPIVAKNALQVIGLPIILAERSKYSDAFTQFSLALFEEVDLAEALRLAALIGQEAENDVLLKPHAEKLKRQALLYVFEVQTRLYKTNMDLTSFCTKQGIPQATVAAAITEVQNNLKEDG